MIEGIYEKNTAAHAAPIAARTNPDTIIYKSIFFIRNSPALALLYLNVLLRFDIFGYTKATNNQKLKIGTTRPIKRIISDIILLSPSSLAQNIFHLLVLDSIDAVHNSSDNTLQPKRIYKYVVRGMI